MHTEDTDTFFRRRFLFYYDVTSLSCSNRDSGNGRVVFSCRVTGLKIESIVLVVLSVVVSVFFIFFRLA